MAAGAGVPELLFGSITLFVLLLALNIGAGCWLLFAAPREPAALPATDPGVPSLQLLSERDAAAAHPDRLRAIVAVSDGVSTSPHSDVASQIAVDRATDTLIGVLTDRQHSDEPRGLAPVETYWYVAN